LNAYNTMNAIAALLFGGWVLHELNIRNITTKEDKDINLNVIGILTAILLGITSTVLVYLGVSTGAAFPEAAIGVLSTEIAKGLLGTIGLFSFAIIMALSCLTTAAASEWFFTPLVMKNTTFTPKNRDSCAATGVSDRNRSLRGEICQDLEHALGEVLGSDGLFSNAQDMFVFSRMLLEKGIHNTHRIFAGPSLERMTRGVSNAGLFQEPSSYLQYIVGGGENLVLGIRPLIFLIFRRPRIDSAIGKMGGAGTFLLIDPAYDLVIVYLTDYGQPERSLEGDEGWNRFFRDIDVMGLCNMVLGKLV